jgi:hypothetical protein
LATDPAADILSAGSRDPGRGGRVARHRRNRGIGQQIRRRVREGVAGQRGCALRWAVLRRVDRVAPHGHQLLRWMTEGELHTTSTGRVANCGWRADLSSHLRILYACSRSPQRLPSRDSGWLKVNTATLVYINVTEPWPGICMSGAIRMVTRTAGQPRLRRGLTCLRSEMPLMSWVFADRQHLAMLVGCQPVLMLVPRRGPAGRPPMPKTKPVRVGRLGGSPG